MVFSGRREAGRKLSGLFSGLPLRAPIVLALPKGGVPVGFEIARALGCPLEPLLVRKLCAENPPHHGFGALSENGAAEMSEPVARLQGMSGKDIGDRLGHAAHVLERRLMLYRPDHRLPSLGGRSVILADDFADSGWSVLAALARIRHEEPHEIILALPVLPKRAERQLRHQVDRLLHLHLPDLWDGPKAWFAEPESVSDEDALELLALEKRSRPLKASEDGKTAMPDPRP